MGSNGDIHIFDRGSFEPPTGFFQRLNSPNAGGPVKPEETQKMAVHLLFDLEMEAKIDVL